MGSPNFSAHDDNIKALEEARLDAERGMFMFDGAIELLGKQYIDSTSTGNCAVCLRTLNKKLAEDCTKHLQEKKECVSKIRNEEALALHDNCVSALIELGSKDIFNSRPSTPRLAFYVRTGALSELRQQKMECLATASCFACTRSFTKDEFCSFLKRVDHRAASMERELHIHPKFCPIEIPFSQVIPEVVKSNGTKDDISVNSHHHNKKKHSKRVKEDTTTSSSRKRRELVI